MTPLLALKTFWNAILYDLLTCFSENSNKTQRRDTASAMNGKKWGEVKWWDMPSYVLFSPWEKDLKDKTSKRLKAKS